MAGHCERSRLKYVIPPEVIALSIMANRNACKRNLDITYKSVPRGSSVDQDCIPGPQVPERAVREAGHKEPT